MARTFSIKTLGCKLNQHESAQMASQLVAEGWTAIPFGQPADMVIVNTCTVTDRSDKKCRNYIRQGAQFSRDGRVVVTGCLFARDPEGIRRMPEVSLAVSGDEREHIASLVGVSPASGASSRSSNAVPLPFFRSRGSIKIQDGCDGACSYCIVPAVRGAPRSMPMAEILDHARFLIDAGVPELVLTGITIGKYAYEGRSLADLARALADLPGKFRLRITSIEPNHVSDALIDVYSHEKVCQHIHLPLQSGSDRVLSAMRRPYTAAQYQGAVDSIRRAAPEIAVGADVIVGFPLEDDAAFNETLSLVRNISFAYVHQFTFSPRRGTEASRMPRSGGAMALKRRADTLREVSLASGISYRRRFEGRIMECVVENNANRDGYTAVSGNYIKIDLEKDGLDALTSGGLMRVRMLRATEAGASGCIFPV